MKIAAERPDPFPGGIIPAVTPDEVLTWFDIEAEMFPEVTAGIAPKGEATEKFRMMDDHEAQQALLALEARAGIAPARVVAIMTRVTLFQQALLEGKAVPSNDRAAAVAAHELNALIDREYATEEKILPVVRVIATFPFTGRYASGVPRAEVAAFRQALLDVARAAVGEG